MARFSGTSRARGLLVMVAVAIPGLVFAWEPGRRKAETEKPVEAGLNVEKLAWMAGDWQGEIFGAPITERWQQPVDGVITGSSRLGRGRSDATYEFMLIEEKDGAPTMFIRHFRQHLKTQEQAPMEFRLTQATDKNAVFVSPDTSHRFTRITYEREGKKTLVVKLEGGAEGGPPGVTCRMTRAR